ncbi:4'-phosphopantetheinyl transferase superfamily protein [Streptomyces sp. ML-6]|uniref:4'-phosphopantetheinyl transferase family protein n=1 Tax=Streptomyces sp. ML-6 TaxID=2982693 RepID=UPI0024C0C6D5|nr:4'-phosphopantetheinyl transferase superfamily protein [Streptomyces sp. ML-6]MDK0524481.1 4'-phosphopantetheinyl transferase superfamily protein [Streptomyces sp. ML-6]
MRAQVWVLRVPVAAAGPLSGIDASVLDEEERRRMAAFARDEDRVRYGFARTALRTILSTRTGTAPDALRFARDPCPCCDEAHGRPVLTSAAAEFSLSYGRSLVLIGVAPVPVGVDVEPVPEPEAAERLGRMLHPAESAEVLAVPPKERPAAFARLWARKEAYLKGLGTGFGRDIAADDVRGDLPGWCVTDLPVGPGHAAAVAVGSARARTVVRVHRTLPEL